MSKEQSGSNLTRVHTFKAEPVELTTCLAMPLEMPGHCSSSALFWKQVTRATWGAMHVPVWGYRCSEGEGSSRSSDFSEEC